MLVAATTAGDVHLLRISSTSSDTTYQKKKEMEEKDVNNGDGNGKVNGEEDKEVEYMGENDQTGTSIDIETSFKLTGEIYSTPIVGFDQRSIYVGCRDDSCHCLVFEESAGNDLEL